MFIKEKQADFVNSSAHGVVEVLVEALEVEEILAIKKAIVECMWLLTETPEGCARLKQHSQVELVDCWNF